MANIKIIIKTPKKAPKKLKILLIEIINIII